MARKTSASSSTLSKIGFAMVSSSSPQVQLQVNSGLISGSIPDQCQLNPDLTADECQFMNESELKFISHQSSLIGCSGNAPVAELYSRRLGSKNFSLWVFNFR
jgi:hypothetical protein